MITTFRLPLFFLGFLFLITSCNRPSEPPSTGSDKRAVFIIVDGISADILEQTDTPNLDKIIEEGAYSRGWLGGLKGEYSESPTVSAVGYNHVLTGVWSNKHNVYSNSIDHPNYHYWNIFRLFKFNHPGKPVAIYSSWLDNRTKLVGDGLPEAGNIDIGIHYDGFDVDTLAFPHVGEYIRDIDEHVSGKAAESIREEGPWLSWVYLWNPDQTGHDFGEGEKHVESIRVADRQVGKIWNAVQHRVDHFNEDWLFVVTTDHGRRLPDGKKHGKQSDRERTIWIVTNKNDVHPYFHQSRPAVTDIYPTISRHLGLEIPESLQRELDGVPFRGTLSVTDPEVTFDEETESIDISWTVWDDEGTVDILVATTNEFSNGGEDHYKLAGTAPVSSGQAGIDVSESSSGFYKIVLEAPHNTVNRWVVVEKNE